MTTGNSTTQAIEPEEIEHFALMLEEYCKEQGKEDPLWLLALCIGFTELLKEELGIESTRMFTSLDGGKGDGDNTH